MTAQTRPHYHVPTPQERIANLEMTIARCQYEIALLQGPQPPLMKYLRRRRPITDYVQAKRERREIRP